MSNIEQLQNIPDLENKLSEPARIQYNKFTNKTRKLQYLLSRVIVKDTCGKDIVVDENGKPTIKSGFLSIAHKDNWVIVAISDTEIGIDIENMNVDRDFEKASKLLGIPKTSDRKTFYKNFVRYEAKFKIGKDAKNTHTYFYEMGNYMISICTPKSIKDIHFIPSDIPELHFLCAE